MSVDNRDNPVRIKSHVGVPAGPFLQKRKVDAQIPWHGNLSFAVWRSWRFWEPVSSSGNETNHGVKKQRSCGCCCRRLTTVGAQELGVQRLKGWGREGGICREGKWRSRVLSNEAATDKPKDESRKLRGETVLTYYLLHALVWVNKGSYVHIRQHILKDWRMAERAFA